VRVGDGGLKVRHAYARGAGTKQSTYQHVTSRQRHNQTSAAHSAKTQQKKGCPTPHTGIVCSFPATHQRQQLLRSLCLTLGMVDHQQRLGGAQTSVLQRLQHHLCAPHMFQRVSPYCARTCVVSQYASATVSERVMALRTPTSPRSHLVAPHSHCHHWSDPLVAWHVLCWSAAPTATPTPLTWTWTSHRHRTGAPGWYRHGKSATHTHTPAPAVPSPCPRPPHPRRWRAGDRSMQHRHRHRHQHQRLYHHHHRRVWCGRVATAT